LELDLGAEDDSTDLGQQFTYRKLQAGSNAAHAADRLHSVLNLIGLQLNEGTKDTPERWVRYVLEFMQGTGPTESVIGELFDHERDDSIQGMVIQSAIPFRMICEHHLLPAIGHAHIGYLPRNKVVGLSKLTRLVDAVGTEKPTLQEAITNRIAAILFDKAECMGVMVMLEAEHTCMACRGVNRAGVKTITSSVLGVFRDVPAARSEFLSLINKKGQI
jgi:GTP cyclohydrolase I